MATHPLSRLCSSPVSGTAFDALGDGPLGERYALVLTDLPGFGQAEPLDQELTLETCADLVRNVIIDTGASIVIGHSLGSIVASLAAARSASAVQTVISIEGNLTAADAYFSGSAAEHEEPVSFRGAFLARLDEMAANNPIVGRYRSQVAKADPRSLWELGCDAHRFSEIHVAGRVLAESADRVHYMYNAANTPEASLAWLEQNPIPSTQLHGASHWKMVDQPELLAEKLIAVLDDAQSAFA